MKGSNVVFVLGLLTMVVIAKLIVQLSGIEPPSFFLVISSFLFIISIISFLILTVLGGNNSDNFIQLVMVSMVIKLLIYIIFIAIVIYLDKESANANAVLFLAMYLTYSLFEVVIIFKKMSN